MTRTDLWAVTFLGAAALLCFAIAWVML